jgi:hypothetical protein
MKAKAVNPAPETMNINSYSQGALTVGEDAYKIKHEHTPAESVPTEMYKIKKSGDTMETEDIISKAQLTDDMTDEAFVAEIVKAAVPIDEIVKALNDLKAEVEKIKEQPIAKAAVILDEQHVKADSMNYSAEAEFFKARKV